MAEVRMAWTEVEHADAAEDRIKPGAILPIRTPTTEDAGRLKYWKKQNKANRSPPALLMYHPVFERYLVIDGHLRLLAALQDGTPARALILINIWAHAEDRVMEQVEQGGESLLSDLAWMSVEQQNDLLRLRAGEEIPFPVQRTYAYRGGVAAWREDVGARLAELGPTPLDEEFSIQRDPEHPE